MGYAQPGQLSGTLEVDWSQTAIRADNQSAEWLQYFHLFASISIPFPMFQVGRGQEYLYILYPKIGEVLFHISQNWVKRNYIILYPKIG